MKYEPTVIKQPTITALGGGTGLSTLLRGLKVYTENITAIVTVADDGGGSGMIRQDFGILPPGDIRNCILALSNVEPFMEQLLQYRFKEGTLKGQNFGNLLIAAMTDLSNGFEKAVKQISNVLAVTGRVLPVSLDNLSLVATLEDGTIIHGESRIPEIQQKCNSAICEVCINPTYAKALPDVLEAIVQADSIVLGPGSLYTSTIANLLIPEVREAIYNSQAAKIYVSNIMTQPGETNGYTLYDHISAITKHSKNHIIDYVIVNNHIPPQEVLARYAEEGSVPVDYDVEMIKKMGIKVIEIDLLDMKNGFIRHNPLILGQCIIDITSQHTLFTVESQKGG